MVNNNDKKCFKVHRLVALSFIDNSENKSDVNHKDKNKLNNHINNLDWMTRTENNLHRCKGLIITSNKNKPIQRIDINSNEILQIYNSIEEAGIWALENKLTINSHNGRNSIGNCVNGLNKTAYKFKWKYIEKNNLNNEEWKEINLNNIFDEKIVYNKKYYVSNLGRFKNSFETIMENYKINENGYIRVSIYNRTFVLHRLVALTFLENPHNKQQVNHIDGNKLNNSVSNLEFVTNQENQIHKYKSGLGNNFTRKIVQYDLEMNKIKEFNSIVEASKELNINKTCINSTCLNKQNHTGGYIFKYIEDTNIDFSKKIIINKNIGRNVGQYDLDMNLLKIHNSIADASRNINIHKNNIWAVIHNFTKTSGGFIWKYLD